MATYFETLGNIIKEEKLITLENKILPNSCVLEMIEPYSAYHHELPTATGPGSVFLLTNEFYSREAITRATQNIKKYAKFDFNAATGKIFIYNNTYPCIRIKDINDYNLIPEIQSNYMNEEISFSKNEKIDASGIIKIKKYFSVEAVDGNIFLDRIDKEMGYFRIPNQITWKLFVKIIKSIKNNWDGRHFDAALGSFYRHHEIIDVVRIFKSNVNAQILETMRESYLKEITNVDVI